MNIVDNTPSRPGEPDTDLEQAILHELAVGQPFLNGNPEFVLQALQAAKERLGNVCNNRQASDERLREA